MALGLAEAGVEVLGGNVRVEDRLVGVERQPFAGGAGGVLGVEQARAALAVGVAAA